MRRAKQAARKTARTLLTGADVIPAACTHASAANLKLAASCMLRDCAGLQTLLLAVDFDDTEVLLDGSAVERIDSAGLQLLLAFAKFQFGRGRIVRWTAVSPELARNSRLLGLHALLGIPDSMAAGDSHGR